MNKITTMNNLTRILFKEEIALMLGVNNGFFFGRLPWLLKLHPVLDANEVTDRKTTRSRAYI